MGTKKRKGGNPFEALRELKDKVPAERGSPTPPVASKPVEPTRPGDPDDAGLLFHRLFAGVTPLDRSRGRVPRERGEPTEGVAPSATSRLVAPDADAEEVRDRMRELVEGGARFEVADDGRRVEGRRVELPVDMLRRLRRGLLPIDARLDLHGMGAKEARAQLELFLRTMRARGERCVLVVHGKGEHSPQGLGVLRGEIAAWLSQGGSSNHVSAFATAREGDGGEGAVYVLLRK